MKVLLVEDDRKISSFIKKGLKEQGFLVDACENGDDGYALASGQAYDVLVLDIMLPGRDGLSLAREIVHAHRGDLRLDPGPSNEVSFTLSLPCSSC
jgi:DNA-binding response OmpR family regulator